MPSAFSIFILKMIALFTMPSILGTLDHFSHFTCSEFLKKFAKKTSIFLNAYIYYKAD